MNLYSLTRQYGKLILEQRNLWIAFFVLFFVNVVLTLSLVFKSDRVILVPSWQGKEGWVEKGAVSSSYLEGWATYIASMLLEMTPHTVKERQNLVLRYTAPQYYNSLKKKLEEEEERLKKEGISTSFLPSGILIDSQNLNVTLTGEFISYIGGKFHQATRDTYQLHFEIKDFELRLLSFELKERHNAA